METSDAEWYYSELLKLLKEKEEKIEKSIYMPIVLELPLPINIEQSIGDEKEEKNKDRGIIIIEL